MWFKVWKEQLHKAWDAGQIPVIVYQGWMHPSSKDALLGGSQAGEVKYALAHARGRPILFLCVDDLLLPRDLTLKALLGEPGRRPQRRGGEEVLEEEAGWAGGVR